MALTLVSTWFKSSYSDGTGNNCVEVAWFKSSYSGGTGNDCVEVADLATHIGIRDSKVKGGPALHVPTGAWSSFVAFAAGAPSL
ncbi:DUF397 domain-containing protein [Streptomyces qinzhouensis]|uniref:DUF397 domain-containing protein n=1 Tax=Streptomyces qinzhouensis TaxID=2599401 RepID=A0A5B8JA67_9ACTN|nr:DUF397 domain-containing protein [Streptomyces qinzhouensis]QDY77324.1 DUF397 domain-containing protein [Streptomyces qinzhouensis]